ncbi:type VII secretion protein EccE [Mycolicibacterium aubagnense]|uniref:ESX-3 secretion system protein EccE3 n=1 Tax=Mycolicibacterium aubagnense TaxID=319707 RepID=A0ABN5YYR9_9MYCO|nr:type VII secretion protein EccE [Mycolicibacterium aubagnense]TLH69702.1 type VII secretion protein EccE [Mycolicibacterium aubagnense]WGI32526.1 type VII secretion protein EccE [Mycolicibacterium aubagnense]BBX85894.1 ESX-3 secretion system protein EccE3 [Mycolicibacterium aubagnense]
MTARITLALLAIIPATMTYPWHTTPQKWILGVAVAVVLLVFAWWRGMFLTTMVARRVAVWRRNRRGTPPAAADQVTVVLEADEFPYHALPLVASYVDRYGVRCDSVRVTERRLDDMRRAWVSVTVAAASNIAALQARSSDLPLADTAEKVARRLGDQLREAGVSVGVTEAAPALVAPDARESWRAVRDGDGYLTAYGLPADQRLPECLAALSSTTELCTVLEFSPGATISAACAVRTANAPAAAAVAGLARESGRQGQLLAAMAPSSAGRLGTRTGALTAELLAELAVHDTGTTAAVQSAVGA